MLTKCDRSEISSMIADAFTGETRPHGTEKKRALVLEIERVGNGYIVKSGWNASIPKAICVNDIQALAKIRALMEEE